MAFLLTFCNYTRSPQGSVIRRCQSPEVEVGLGWVEIMGDILGRFPGGFRLIESRESKRRFPTGDQISKNSNENPLDIAS